MKEELSEQYRSKAYEVSPTRKRCQHNNEVIAWNNEIVGAFESGYDAGKQENEHLIWKLSEANYEKGKKDMKEQMMKDAVVFHSKILPANEIETDYALDDFDEDEVSVITNAVNDGKFKCGDKVIIALFKDE